MKRNGIFFLIILSILISFVGCNCASEDNSTHSSNTEYSSNITMPTQTTDPMYTLGSLTVFKTDDGILVELHFPESATVQFRSDRSCIDNGGLKLIDNDELQTFLGKELQSIGDCHVELGNGFLIPSYITTDGYLISFYVNEDDIIYSAIKKDLFTNTTEEDSTWVEKKG